MTKAEMLSRMDSRELSEWYSLYQVEADERQEERDRLESGDGIVHDPMRDQEDEDDDGDEHAD